MTGKEFLNSLANGQSDVVQQFLDVLAECSSKYCLIGGLAVNAYTEPVVSLDLDVVVAVDQVECVAAAAEARGMRTERFEHSINLTSPKSDLRIQIQTDRRYQDFLSRSAAACVLGYSFQVASVADVLQGKIWAYLDPSQRKSKRQKDLADIMRLVEAHPALADRLPPELRRQIED